jgi:hypothetical protein
MYAVQYTDSAPHEAGANDMLAWLATQVDYIGGRVYYSATDRVWRVQAFFQDLDDPMLAAWLPDGCRRVMVPVSQQRALGIL